MRTKNVQVIYTYLDMKSWSFFFLNEDSAIFSKIPIEIKVLKLSYNLVYCKNQNNLESQFKTCGLATFIEMLFVHKLGLNFSLGAPRTELLQILPMDVEWRYIYQKKIFCELSPERHFILSQAFL